MRQDGGEKRGEEGADEVDAVAPGVDNRTPDRPKCHQAGQIPALCVPHTLPVIVSQTSSERPAEERSWAVRLLQQCDRRDVVECACDGVLRSDGSEERG